jgi:hypothetical protein
MDLKEIADDYLDKGYTITLRQEPDGTLELTAEKGVSGPATTSIPPPAPTREPRHQVGGAADILLSAERGKGVTMSKENLAELKRLRRSGLSYPEISKRTGWSTSTIGKRLR